MFAGDVVGWMSVIVALEISGLVKFHLDTVGELDIKSVSLFVDTDDAGAFLVFADIILNGFWNKC